MDREEQLEESWWQLIGELQFFLNEEATDHWEGGFPDSFDRTFGKIRLQVNAIEDVGKQLAILVHERKRNDDYS